MIDKLIKKRNELMLHSSFETNMLSLAFCAERMKLLYIYFAEEYILETKWYIKKIENVIFNRIHNLKVDIKYIENKIPDAEDYPEVWAIFGQCSVLCLLKLYKYLDTQNLEQLNGGFIFMDEVIDFYLQDAEEFNCLSKAKYDLFKRELEWEIELLELLSSENFNEINIKSLQDKNKNYLLPKYPNFMVL